MSSKGFLSKHWILLFIIASVVLTVSYLIISFGASKGLRYFLSFLILAFLSPAFLISAIAPIVVSTAIRLASDGVAKARSLPYATGSTLKAFADYKEGVAPYTMIEYAIHYYSTWAACMALVGALISSALHETNLLGLQHSIYDASKDVPLVLIAIAAFIFIGTLLFGFINPFSSASVISTYDKKDRYMLFGIIMMPPWNAITAARTVVLCAAVMHIIIIKMWYYNVIPLLHD
jgi:hypothetical protein